MEVNSTIYHSILLRPRVFVGVSKVSLSTRLLGHAVQVPFFVIPAAQATLAHPVGERGIADACAKHGVCQIISGNAALSPEDIVANSPPSRAFGFQILLADR